MSIDYGGHVVHARVAQFHCVPVEYLVQLRRFGEMMVKDLEEFLADDSRNISGERWVEPCYVAFAVFVFWCLRLTLVVSARVGES